jgi:hypothetical protein
MPSKTQRTRQTQQSNRQGNGQVRMTRRAPRVSIADPELTIDGSDIVITSSSFPVSPIWDALTAEYGDPYRPMVMTDALRAARAITNPDDPIWDEVRRELVHGPADPGGLAPADGSDG